MRPMSLRGVALPPAANFATAPRGVAFEAWPAGVRVDLGVEHQHVHVAAGGQHVVEARRADVVGPAVAADDPDGLAHEVAGEAREAPRGGVAAAPRGGARAPPRARAARRPPRRRGPSSARIASASVLADPRRELAEQAARLGRLPLEGEAHAEAELGVVLEQRVGPRRAAARGVAWSREWSGGCRRRSRSSPSRSRRAPDRRRAGTAASGRASRRSRRRRPRTRRAAREPARA